MTLFDTENEVAYLSILINNPEEISNNPIDKVMLGSEPNKFIYESLQSFSEQNITPDVSLLVNSLGSKGKLDLAGGKTYLEFIKGKTYARDNIAEYRQLIVDSYKAKKAVEIGKGLNNLTSNPNADVNKALESAQTELDNLILSSNTEQTNSLEDVLKESWGILKDRITNPGTVGIPTGISGLDLATGGVDKTLWIIAGQTHVGKSGVMLNMAYNMAKAGVPVLYHSLEMGKVMVGERLLSIASGIPGGDIHLGLLDQKKVNLLVDTISEIKKLPFYLDSNFSSDLGYVISNIKKYKKQKGIEVVFIDYLQLMVDRESNNLVNALGNVSRRLLLTSNTMKVGCVLGSQLHRGLETRDDKRPNKADLRGSGNLEEDAFVIALLYRDELVNNDSKFKGKIELILDKNKQTGRLGSIIEKFDPETSRVG